MELTAARLRTLAETARMIVGADDVEIGPGDERRVPVTLYFNREGGDAHGDPHADGPDPAGRGPVVVVKEITTNELAADGLGGRGGDAPGETELARPFTLTEGKTKSLTRRPGDPIPPRPASPPPSQHLPAAQIIPCGPGIAVISEPLVSATAFIAPDFEQKPWHEPGRQWPHPESYLDKLRLFRSRENDGDRKVIVTVCLAAQDDPKKETS